MKVKVQRKRKLEILLLKMLIFTKVLAIPEIYLVCLIQRKIINILQWFSLIKV